MGKTNSKLIDSYENIDLEVQAHCKENIGLSAPVFEKDNLFLLTEAFTSMDPTMKVLLEQPRGKVVLSTIYDENREQLHVKIHGVKDIRPTSFRMSTCDPFVRVYLRSRGSESISFDSSVYQTRVAHDALEAEFEDAFCFSLVRSSLSKMRLVIELWDEATLISYSRCIGIFELKLRINYRMKCIETVPKINELIKGKIKLHMLYDKEQECLQIYNLRVYKCLAEDCMPVKCRLLLLGNDNIAESKEIGAINHSVEWDDTFSIPILLRELHSKSLLITVSGTSSSQERIDFGQLLWPLAGVVIGEELRIKEKLRDLTTYYEENCQLLTKGYLYQHLRLSYMAHVVARAPNIIFQNPCQRKEKRIIVRCRKGGEILFEGHVDSTAIN